MNGGGDQLARGAKSAMFGPPKVERQKETVWEMPRAKKVIWGECKCGFKAWTVGDFSDHYHEVHCEMTTCAKARKTRAASH